MVTDEELMNIAQKEAKNKVGFYIHFACYILVNIAMLITWVYFFEIKDVQSLFPIVSGPIFGWGIGIVAHFISVFAGPSEKRVKKEFKKLKEQQE